MFAFLYHENITIFSNGQDNFTMFYILFIFVVCLGCPERCVSMNDLVFHTRKKTLEWRGITIINPKDVIQSAYRTCITISGNKLELVSVRINDANIFFCKNPIVYKKLKKLLTKDMPALHYAYEEYGHTNSQTKDFFDFLLADTLNSTISSSTMLSEAGIPASRYKMENAWNNMLIASSKLDLAAILKNTLVLQASLSQKK